METCGNLPKARVPLPRTRAFGYLCAAAPSRRPGWLYGVLPHILKGRQSLPGAAISGKARGGRFAACLAGQPALRLFGTLPDTLANFPAHQHV